MASLVVAGRDNGFADADTRRVALAAGARYRKAMREFAGLATLTVWYSRLDGQVRGGAGRLRRQLRRSDRP